MNLISKAVVNLWSIYKPMNFRGRYLITYATVAIYTLLVCNKMLLMYGKFDKSFGMHNCKNTL